MPFAKKENDAMTDLLNTEDGMDWLEAELADTLDEDYELEISEPALSMEIRKIYQKAHPPSIPRAASTGPKCVRR